MHPHRHITRVLALTLAAAALAMPGSAAAMPALEPGSGTDAVRSAPEPAARTAAPQAGGDDQTIALVVSGAALVIALAGAGHARLMGRRLGQPTH